MYPLLTLSFHVTLCWQPFETCHLSQDKNPHYGSPASSQPPWLNRKHLLSSLHAGAQPSSASSGCALSRPVSELLPLNAALPANPSSSSCSFHPPPPPPRVPLHLLRGVLYFLVETPLSTPYHVFLFLSLQLSARPQGCDCFVPHLICSASHGFQYMVDGP